VRRPSSDADAADAVVRPSAHLPREAIFFWFLLASRIVVVDDDATPNVGVDGTNANTLLGAMEARKVNGRISFMVVYAVIYIYGMGG